MSETPSDPNYKRLLLPGLIALSATVTVVLMAASAVLLGVIPIGSGPTATANRSRAHAEPRRATPTPAATQAATAHPSIPADVLNQMEQIESEISELRGLQPSAPITRRLITADELETFAHEQLLAGYGPEQAAAQVRLWSLFGWVEPDFDLWGFYTNLYTQQVAGFYDPNDEIIYLLQSERFAGPERLTYAHEYVHVLQHQNFDVGSHLRPREPACDGDRDRCMAGRALIEGDAGLLEAQWLRTYASEQDREQINAFYETFESPLLRAAPEYMREAFLFPYRAGLEFAAWTFRNGGWAEIDEAYANPPASSEQITQPAGYPDDSPIRLQPPNLEEGQLGEGWRTLSEGTLGHFNARMLLAEHLPAEDADLAADGWGGDWYASFYHDGTGGTAVVIVQAWDTIRDSQQAYLAWRQYGEARIGAREPLGDAYEWRSEAMFARLERASNQTLWIMAPDAETGAALRAAVPFPLDDE